MNAHEVGSIELQLRDENDTLLYVVPFYRRFIDDESYLSVVFKVAEKWRHLIYNLINNQRKINHIKTMGMVTSSN
jgi:hypothetical protein